MKCHIYLVNVDREWVKKQKINNLEAGRFVFAVQSPAQQIESSDAISSKL
jgi:hypothetical protein